MKTGFRAENNRNGCNGGRKYWADPVRIPEHVRFAKCVCGKLLIQDRIPDVGGPVYDAYCLCGHRYQLPKGYKP
jgi:hypothetical protein